MTFLFVPSFAFLAQSLASYRPNRNKDFSNRHDAILHSGKSHYCNSFFCAEGPRSRFYGRTAALIVTAMMLFCILGKTITVTVFFSGEGPRSRYYGRTAALRLIVQPCDEDER
jgi:hypothetical protein